MTKPRWLQFIYTTIKFNMWFLINFSKILHASLYWYHLLHAKQRFLIEYMKRHGKFYRRQRIHPVFSLCRRFHLFPPTLEDTFFFDLAWNKLFIDFPISFKFWNVFRLFSFFQMAFSKNRNDGEWSNIVSLLK